MPLPSGYRLYDQNGSPINSTNPLNVTFGTGALTVTVGDVGINTITASSPINANYSKYQQIINSTDYAQSITYAYHTTTTEYYVSAINHSSVALSLSASESFIYTGTGTADFRVVSIGLS